MNENLVIIKNSLDFIVQQAFGTDNSYCLYHLSFVPKEGKKTTSRYLVQERKIELFNLTRSPKQLLFNCLQTISYHIEFMQTGNMGDVDCLNEIVYQLLVTTLGLTTLTCDDLLSEEGIALVESLIEDYGEPSTWDIPEFPLTEECIISVSNGFVVKAQLKKCGFTWISQSQTWEKECHDQGEATRLMDYLASKTTSSLTSTIRSKYDIEFTFYYYLAVSNGYPHRDKLKERGYIYNGYGHATSTCWIKKVKSNEYYEEIHYLAHFNGVQYKRVNPKQVKTSVKKETPPISDQRKGVTRFVPIFKD